MLQLRVFGETDLVRGGQHLAGDLRPRPPCRRRAATTLIAPSWEDTTVLRGDLAAAIGELKAKQGGELQVRGSGALTRWLLEKAISTGPPHEVGAVRWPGSRIV